MADISDTVLAKSDQLNADDLIGGPITITITRVNKVKDEQPIAISYENDQGKPYKPGKSMRRVLIALYGKDSDAYLGKTLVLYRDPAVKFGKLAVGGIRISHASGIDGEKRIVITVKQGQKGEFVVKPFRPQQTQQQPAITQDKARADIKAAESLDDLRVVYRLASKEGWWPELNDEFQARRADIDPPKEEQTDERQPEPASGDSDDGYDGV